jgi:hypothetical protein
MAEDGLNTAVSGISMAIVEVGPRPGRTPTKVPSKTPTNTMKRLVMLRAEVSPMTKLPKASKIFPLCSTKLRNAYIPRTPAGNGILSQKINNP